MSLDFNQVSDGNSGVFFRSTIDGTKITMVAKALIDYTAAMAEGSKGSWFGAIGSVGSLVTGAVDGLTSFITGGKKKSYLD